VTIALIGNMALIIALCFALAQSIFPLWGHFRHNVYLLAFARPSAFGQCFFILVAYFFLTLAFATNDFSIAYVAANSHSSLPLMYKLTAVWGAHEGSILLWIVILNAWTIGFSFYKKDPALLPLVIAILGIISLCFLCFLLLTSNPFLTTLTPQSGQDLNPLLQDPGFVIHPPFLYTGYVGFSVAFAITQAALLRGVLDHAWAELTRRFALAAWCFLTLGITLGSWWAYRVLGWGGFWFWDPVENASLLPWLSGIALIHVLVLVEKRGMATGWASLLAIITFALSLLGTFLVRSGVLISAHTFANDPARGVFLLLLLALVSTAALIIYLLRLPQFLSSPRLPFSWRSRELALWLNSALLSLAMTTILLGTLYPLLLDALHLGTISVGAPYFNKVMLPLTLVLMVFMGLGALSTWTTATHTPPLWPVLIKKALISLLSATACLWGSTGQLAIIPLLALSLSFWVILSAATAWRSQPGMTLAHTGFALLVIGLMLSSTLNEEREVRVKPGDATQVGPYQFIFLDTQQANGTNYHGIRANFAVNKQQRHITILSPEKRIYTVRDMVMTKVAIHPSIFRDLYLALGEPLDAQYWSVRIYYKPFVRFIWGGGLLMMIGGIVALRPRKENRKLA